MERSKVPQKKPWTWGHCMHCRKSCTTVVSFSLKLSREKEICLLEAKRTAWPRSLVIKAFRVWTGEKLLVLCPLSPTTFPGLFRHVRLNLHFKKEQVFKKPGKQSFYTFLRWLCTLSLTQVCTGTIRKVFFMQWTVETGEVSSKVVGSSWALNRKVREWIWASGPLTPCTMISVPTTFIESCSHLLLSI